MESEHLRDNQRALAAAADPRERERFLGEERLHILRLAAKIVNRPLTESDDEWSIAFIASSEALDSYNEEKGDYWGYAAVVIRNRLYDYLRKESRHSGREMSISPEAFNGDLHDRDTATALEIEVSKRSQERVVDQGLKEEIRALREELQDYGISFRDLSECSPKTDKTVAGCREAIRSIFLPPPLMALLRKNKSIPVKEVMQRSGVKKKLLERHRKHLIAAALVLDGDYPGMREYFPYGKE